MKKLRIKCVNAKTGEITTTKCLVPENASALDVFKEHIKQKKEKLIEGSNKSG